MAWGGTLENITMGGIGTDGSDSWLGLEVEVQDEKALHTLARTLGTV
jgi:hypothetical protein